MELRPRLGCPQPSPLCVDSHPRENLFPQTPGTPVHGGISTRDPRPHRWAGFWSLVQLGSKLPQPLRASVCSREGGVLVGLCGGSGRV